MNEHNIQQTNRDKKRENELKKWRTNKHIENKERNEIVVTNERKKLLIFFIWFTNSVEI